MVENHARAKGIKAITLEIANEGIDQAKVAMEEAVKDPAKMQEILNKLMPKKSQEAAPTATQPSSTNSTGS